jgi:hypothetical protein
MCFYYFFLSKYIDFSIIKLNKINNKILYIISYMKIKNADKKKIIKKRKKKIFYLLIYLLISMNL